MNRQMEVHACADDVRGHAWRARRPLWRVLAVTACPLFFLAWAPCHAVAETWARKMFETTSHDFGTLARGSKAEFEFVFTNSYLGDVNVASVRSSCACAAVRVKEPLLKTYQKGAIVASINTRAFLGRRAATITVTFDEPMHAQVQLHVTCHIRGDVLVQPETVDFGNVEQGHPIEKKVSIGYTGRDGWEILGLQNQIPYLAAEVVETSRGHGQVSYELRVRLAENAPPGYLKEHLILKTNDSQTPHLPILVGGRVVSAVTVSPASLFLGVLRPGEEVTRQLVVRSKEPFRIVSIRCNSDQVRIDVPRDSVPKPLHLIPVAFVAGAELGKVAGILLVETDGGTVCELPVYAVVSRE